MKKIPSITQHGGILVIHKFQTIKISNYDKIMNYDDMKFADDTKFDYYIIMDGEFDHDNDYEKEYNI